MTDERPIPEEDLMPAVRLRVLGAGAVGVLLALVLFALVLGGGRSSLLDRDLFGGFYDGQARSLLDGRLDVDPDVPGIEGFRMGDRTHIYQGLTPALARMPLFVLTDRFDARLTGVSMLLAVLVSGIYVVLAWWRLRRSLLGDRRPSWFELVGTSIAVFGVLSSSLLFLASTAWVYHESLIWGAALALGSFTHLVLWLTAPGRLRPGPRSLAHLGAAAALGALALNTRSSVGGGPLAALALVALCLLVPPRWVERTLGWVPRPEGASTRTRVAAIGIVVVGLLAGVALYAGVNRARFDSWFGVPLERQVLVGFIPGRLEALQANDGSLFRAEFVPSVALQVVRPDALGFRGQFPWISFPEQRPTALGDAVFVDRDWSSSIPASAPLLAIGSVLGLFALAVPRRWLGEAGEAVLPWRIVVLGAAAGALPFLAFGYIAQRYLVDLVPLLVLCSLLGLGSVLLRLVERPSTLRSSLALAAVCLTALWGGAANAALALQYQQEISPRRTESERSGWLQRQIDLGARFEPLRVGPVDPLPPATVVGELLVVGDCEAMYRSNGSSWRLIESSAASGGWLLDVRRDGELGEPVALLRSDDGDGESAELLLEPLGGDDVRLVVAVDRDGEVQRTLVGPTFALAEGDTVPMRVAMDHRTNTIVVDRAGTEQELLGVEIDLPDSAADEPAGDGTVVVSGRSSSTPLCAELTA